jgi:hypothetical protein
MTSETHRREGREAIARLAPAWVSPLAWLAVVVGAIAFAVGVRAADPAPAWRALLVNFLFWVSLAQGALIWSVIFRITRTSWSAPINRMGHAVLWFLPFCLLAFAGIIVGRGYLLPWLGHDMGDRAVWLNARGLFARDGIGLVVLVVLSWAFVRGYLRDDSLVGGHANGDMPAPQDDGRTAGGHPPRKGLGEIPALQERERRVNRRLSVLGVALLFVYMVVFSLLGFDLVMSLTPAWHSALFGWYFALGGLYLGMAWLVIVAVVVRKTGTGNAFPFALPAGSAGRDEEEAPISASVTEGECAASPRPVKERIGTTELRNLGNLMLAFAMLMTYFLYSQALPIWYENLPPETGWVILRVHHQPWQALSWVLIFTCYLGVFALLVVREMKEKPATLMAVALLVLASMWLERYMLVVPSLAPKAEAHSGTPLLAVLVGVGFLGVLVLTTTRFLARYPATSELDLALRMEREKWE